MVYLFFKTFYVFFEVNELEKSDNLNFQEICVDTTLNKRGVGSL